MFVEATAEAVNYRAFAMGLYALDLAAPFWRLEMEADVPLDRSSAFSKVKEFPWTFWEVPERPCYQFGT